MREMRVSNNMSSPDDFIVVGRIGATYGIKGWLKIFSFTEIHTDILEMSPWYVGDARNRQAAKVEDGREHGKGIVVKIAGYNNPEEARTLTGKEIFIKRSQLPTLKKNEYYWSDLQGLTVINQRGENLGIISYLIETGSNDVFVVKGEKGETAIPYLPGRVVTSIDLNKREVHVDWEEPL